MLENRELWLEPWFLAAGGPRCRIRAAPGRTLLGQARYQPPVSVWKRLWSRPVLEVVETEDESLLFTLHRLWGWGGAWWELRDADGRCVGTVSRGEIRDPLGRLVATVVPESSGPSRRLLARDGPELAAVTGAAEGRRVQFASVVDDNPFAKMLLLAVALLPED
jgi:hypothetical protein